MNETKEITKGQFITWIVTVVIFLIGIFLSTYLNIDSRIRALEVNVHALEVKRDAIERDLDILMSDTKEIKSTLNNLDKRLSIEEHTYKKQHE